MGGGGSRRTPQAEPPRAPGAWPPERPGCAGLPQSVSTPPRPGADRKDRGGNAGPSRGRDLDAASARPGRARARQHQPQSHGWRRAGARRRGRRRGLPPRPRPAPRRGAGAAAGRRPRRRCHLLRQPGALRSPRAHPAVRRRADRRRRHPGGGGHRGPRPQRPRPGLRAAARRRRRGRGRGGRGRRRQGRPRVTLKAAASLDGKVAAPDGTSQWITGEAARADAHRLRAEADAVAVGAGTALADDPRLTVRLPGWSGRQPLRVLVDATGRPVTAAAPSSRPGPSGAAGGQLFDGGAPTLVATTAAARPAALQAWAAAGAEVLVCPEATAATGEAGVDLAFLAKALGERGVLELLVEGGPRLHGSFWEAGLADRLVWYLAPLVIGGDGAPGLLPAAGARTLTAARAIRVDSVERVGPDLRIVGYPQEGT